MSIFASRVLDIVLMLVSVLVLVTSTLLNPMLFWFRFPRRRSPLRASSLLFLLLSASDFLTNAIFPILLITTLAKPAQEPRLRPATHFDLVHFVLFRGLGGASAIITATLAVTRWLTIRYPMLRIKNKLVLCHLALLSVGPILVGVVWSVVRCPVTLSQWSTTFQTVISEGCGFAPLAAHWLIIAHAWTGLVVSVGTMVRLRRHCHPATAARTWHSILTILLMNLLLALHTLVSICVMVTGGRRLDWSRGVVEHPEQAPLLVNIVLYYFTPLVMSAANPLIIFCCNRGVRAFALMKLSIIKDRTLSDTH